MKFILMMAFKADKESMSKASRRGPNRTFRRISGS